MSRRVDLFYHGFEVQALDQPLGRLQSHARLALRTAYRTLRGRQPYTGFYTAFRSLKEGLESVGVDVHVNDFAYARRHPDQPIGVIGHDGVLDRVDLRNPAVFGPGHIGPPREFAASLKGRNVRVIVGASQWPCDMLRPRLQRNVQPLFAPISLAKWPDLSGHAKTCDVVIYDKIHWNRGEMVPRIRDRLRRHLDDRGLSHVVLRYGEHTLSQYRAALASGRTLAFLSAHETQGIAYQEALASGLPVFAWDEGKLIDPEDVRTAPANLVVSSVPYFDERCGVTFTEPQLEARFDRFWAARDGFAPRDYVAENLSPEKSARMYLDLLDQAAAS
ncbi:glycosyltransferase [uncultured Paracoccus sp.]|uniref:glycosyltransferase n=1 Tax=uncultured Paracoccus sp. TaxID=189685 RepID=UPI00260ED1E1|nr:glycosyltransferase [uncultured Paracoccus sp.]